MNPKRLSVNTLAVCPISRQVVTTKAIELRPGTGDLAKKALWWHCPLCHRWHKLVVPTEAKSAVLRCLTPNDDKSRSDNQR